MYKFSCKIWLDGVFCKMFRFFQFSTIFLIFVRVDYLVPYIHDVIKLIIQKNEVIKNDDIINFFRIKPRFSASSLQFRFFSCIKLCYKSVISSYLRVKNAFSIRPVQLVATAMTKVVIPKVEWMGTKAARKDAVADSQHNKSKKLKKPTMNCKAKIRRQNLNFRALSSIIPEEQKVPW